MKMTTSRVLSAATVMFVIVACAPDYKVESGGKNTGALSGRCTARTCKGERSLCVMDANGGATCRCPLGTHEEGTSCKLDATCAADGSSCSQHGSCREDGPNAVACTCDGANGYTGAKCDECISSAGFHRSADGKSCTRDICDVAPNPCAGNGDPKRGRCTSSSGATTCNCEDGFALDVTGKCVMPQACSGRATCSNKGECSVVATKVTCACDAGYTGATCTACAPGYNPKGDGTCFANPCDPNPCATQSNTTCVVDTTKASNYRCDCRFGDGFTMQGAVCGCAADLNACTTDGIVGGKCVHPANVNAACTDGDANVCTTGVCNAAAQCAAVAVANGASCGGDACNVYTCQSATCTYGGNVCNTSSSSGDGDGGGGDGAGDGAGDGG
jgi:hypothetical protein